MKAAIDIGTNTILMVVGNSENGILNIYRDEHSIARLGEGVDVLKRLQPQAIERATVILKKYRAICNELGITHIRAVATSAMRDAENREEVCQIFSELLKTDIEIISGEEEAQLSFLGTVEDEELSTIIDIGGGSTEIVTGRNSTIHSRISLNIGAVRFTERFLKDKPAAYDAIACAENEIRQQLLKADRRNAGKIYAVAGTPTTLAAIAQELHEYSRDAIHGYDLKTSVVETILEKLLKSNFEEILLIPGVHPQRADILPAGAMILKEILHFLQADSCIVSTQGLRFGVLKSMF
jgi:exopolyphosphatase/guanosine-5'-triphosphate,3'-diphosphate pyrophosphatase